MSVLPPLSRISLFAGQRVALSHHFPRRNTPQSLSQQNPLLQACLTLRRLTHFAKTPANGLRQIRTKPLSQHRVYSSNTPWPPPARRPSAQRTRSRGGYTHFSNASPATNPRTARYVTGVTALAVTTYVYANLDHAPFTNRTRILGMSRATEHAMGKHAYSDLLNTFGARLLPPQHPVTARVRRVVSRIASTVRHIDPALSEGFEWAVAVADVPEPNAMCVPGGRILITTGLLAILPSDDHLAIILAHEIAHALNRHGAENMHLQRLLWPIIILLQQIFEMRWVPSLVVTMLLSLPYSRRLEHEADSVGLLLCVEACYDPRVAPGVFHRLAELQNENSGTFVADKVAPFFSTHPQTKERAARLKEELPNRVERYNDKCVHGQMFSQFVFDHAV